MLNALGRFELARRVLNHAAVVETGAEVLHRNFGTELDFEHALVEYGRLLREAVARTYDPRYPAPVLPVVDMASLQVHHTTCTGSTYLSVTPSGFFVSRCWNDSSRDRVLGAILYGEPLPQEAVLFLDRESLRAAGMMVGVCLLRLHGELALYREGTPENYYEVLYTENGVFRDFDHDFGEPDWMESAPHDARDLVYQHLPAEVKK